MIKLRSIPVILLLVFAVGLRMAPGQEADKKPAEDKAKRLVRAAVEGQLERIKKLHAGGVDLDSTDAIGLTAHQVAKIRGYQKVAEWLKENGADPDRSFKEPEVYVAALLSEMTSGDEPGAAVLVSRGGKVLFSKGYGLANVEDKAAITSKTKFRIGSVTKQFTAAAILKLQEDGKLKVEDTLDKFIDDYPRGEEVTLHHLMTHTSGISSYTSKPGFMERVKNPIEADDLIASIKKYKFDFDPGKKWSYSNSGYFLLGHIVEKASGKSYGEYLKETFFDPLKMSDTGIHRPDLGLENEAKGYSLVDGEFEDALDWHMSHAGAAGAIYSTVEDLQRWNAGVFGGKVLNEDSLTAAFTEAEVEDGENPMGYGYGWGIGDHRGLKTISHGGGLQGFTSYLMRFPEQELTVTVLHNASPGKVSPGEVASIIGELYLWEKMEPREEHEAVDVDPAIYAELAGRYDYGSAVMNVTTKDDRLYAQLPGQPNFEIYPASAEKYFWKVVDAQVEFLRDDGKVTAARHTQGGRTFKAPRLKDEKVVKVDAEILDSYVGTYDFNLLGKLVVAHKGKRLTAKLGSQPAFLILPTSESTFFYKFIKANLEFMKNDEGEVDRVVLKQGIIKLAGKKMTE